MRDTAFLLGKRSIRFSGLLAGLGLYVRGEGASILSRDFSDLNSYKDFPSGTEMDLVMVDEEIGISMIGRDKTVSVPREYNRKKLEAEVRDWAQQRRQQRETLYGSMNPACLERKSMPAVYLIGTVAIGHRNVFESHGLRVISIDTAGINRRELDKISSCRWCKFLRDDDIVIADSDYVNRILGGRNMVFCALGIPSEIMFEHVFCHLSLCLDSEGNLCHIDTNA